MTNKKAKPENPYEGKSHSAFPARKPAAAPETGKPAEDTQDAPMPSQPRSFSPVRQQKPFPARKALATPNATPPDADKHDPDLDDIAPASQAASPEEKKTGTIAKPAVPSEQKPQTPPSEKPKISENTAQETAGATPDAAPAAPAAAAAASTPAKPQSSGAGGDTIRLRVTPRPQARTLNTAPGRGLRRRLPDIRGRSASSAASRTYGPFSLFFGFFWLAFKMIFFAVLVLGLGAGLGYVLMTEYIKTPEVTVPNIAGMKVSEAFDVLSAKKLGIIGTGSESSGLVAPGEIISQQPPPGETAKENTSVGVVISSGRSRFVVPSVVNESREIAVNKIGGAGLEVGNILSIEDNNVPEGSVISQTPIGGTGSDTVIAVDLMVSAGPLGMSLAMPNLTGRTVVEARAALEVLGISEIIVEPPDAPLDAVVESHDPLVGKTIFQSDAVTLTTAEEEE